MISLPTRYKSVNKAITIIYYCLYMYLVECGYLSYGETIETCNDEFVSTGEQLNEQSSLLQNDICLKQTIKENDFLKSIHIEIASECNERCVHCYIPHECKTKVINSELFYKIVREGRLMNVINITISGGEPLLHKDFIKFLKICRESDLSVNVLSNLTLLTNEMILEMKKNPLLCVQTSLYSMNPQVHDAITNVKGSFNKTQSAILRLLNEGIPVQISCPIMKQNKATYKEVLNWGKENNISVLSDYVIFAAYDHSNSNLVNRLSLEEVGEAFDLQVSENYINSLKNTAIEKCKLTEESPICSVCRYYFCVSVEGDIFPCAGWQKHKLGNLNEGTLQELWINSREVQILKQIKWKDFPKCYKCEHKGYCTVCMMSNDNESQDGNMFKINDFHCRVAKMIHSKVDSYKG